MTKSLLTAIMKRESKTVDLIYESSLILVRQEGNTFKVMKDKLGKSWRDVDVKITPKCIFVREVPPTNASKVVVGTMR